LICIVAASGHPKKPVCSISPNLPAALYYAKAGDYYQIGLSFGYMESSTIYSNIYVVETYNGNKIIATGAVKPRNCGATIEKCASAAQLYFTEAPQFGVSYDLTYTVSPSVNENWVCSTKTSLIFRTPVNFGGAAYNSAGDDEDEVDYD
jgi:hypothetical protein